MIRFSPASALFQPVRSGLLAVGRQSALVGLAVLLGAFGAISLIAASFVGLIPVVGFAGALALNGLTLLILAAGVLGPGLWRGPVAPPPPPQSAMAADPLVQLVFDLSFSVGNRLAARRRR